MVIAGAGPAGMAAALGARAAGIENILIMEREARAGGVLPQCIHTGFGLSRYGEELTGPEYCARVYDEIKKENIPVLTDTTVMEIYPDRSILAVSADMGVLKLRTRCMILSTGCREKPLGALPVTGTRPSGIFTAGSAQRLINIRGKDIGDNVVILGSGDIGMIMARRLRLLGRNVVAMVEQSGSCTGLKRNEKQCIEEFSIPLLTGHTVTAVHGEERISGVTICPVDDTLSPIPGHETFAACDTLLVSVGLIPEREPISGLFGGEGLPDWLFVAGNADYVHELADDVSREGENVGRRAAEYIKSGVRASDTSNEKEHGRKKTGRDQMICPVCPTGCIMTVRGDEIKGFQCANGMQFAKQELLSPERNVTATVRAGAASGLRLPVRTSEPCDRDMIFAVMDTIKKYTAELPVRRGDLLIKNCAGSGCDIIACADMDQDKEK